MLLVQPGNKPGDRERMYSVERRLAAVVDVDGVVDHALQGRVAVSVGLENEFGGADVRSRDFRLMMVEASEAGIDVDDSRIAVNRLAIQRLTGADEGNSGLL